MDVSHRDILALVIRKSGTPWDPEFLKHITLIAWVTFLLVKQVNQENMFKKSKLFLNIF